jgi:nicotinamidase-related amidase
MALDPARHELVVIDFQERLFGAMSEGDARRALRATENLVWLCRELGVPVLFTEQYPAGLGLTMESLQATRPFVKTAFAATDEEGFFARTAGRPVAILTGMETHVCVAHTAAGLRQAGREVIVVPDACVSRRDQDKAGGLEWIRQLGCSVMPSETVLFGLLGRSGSPAFKQISARIR